MIKPDKHTNLDFSLINVSAFLLKELRINPVISYNELGEMVMNSIGEKAKEVYPYALIFLFLLDKLNYSIESDSFQLNET